jgi:hypothetical protein
VAGADRDARADVAVEEGSASGAAAVPSLVSRVASPVWSGSHRAQISGTTSNSSGAVPKRRPRNS